MSNLRSKSGALLVSWDELDVLDTATLRFALAAFKLPESQDLREGW